MAADRDKKKHERADSSSEASGTRPAEEPIVRDPSTRSGQVNESAEPIVRDPSTRSGQVGESAEPIVRDKRRIDPDTGEARKGAQNGSGSIEETITDEDLAKLLQEALDEPAPNAQSGTDSDHLVDLKRIQAEYANYRKRVDRDRFVARDLAVAEVITGILPILDDLDLAHAHGDLEGSPLELVAQKIRTLFDRYGLVKIGEIGDVFDPNMHEAIAQLPSKNVTVNTIADVVVPGYQLGERLLRPAKVAVSVPED